MVGPVITAAHRERVEGYVQGALDQGAEAAAGGDRPDLRHRLLRGSHPARRSHAGHDRRCSEEIFGPVVVVVPFDDEDEGVALANDSQYGLNELRVLGRLGPGHGGGQPAPLAASVAINTVQRNHEAAFGGFKKSGVGRDGGSWGLHAYSELQSIAWQG